MERKFNIRKIVLIVGFALGISSCRLIRQPEASILETKHMAQNSRFSYKGIRCTGSSLFESDIPANLAKLQNCRVIDDDNSINSAELSVYCRVSIDQANDAQLYGPFAISRDEYHKLASFIQPETSADQRDKLVKKLISRSNRPGCKSQASLKNSFDQKKFKQLSFPGGLYHASKSCRIESGSKNSIFMTPPIDYVGFCGDFSQRALLHQMRC